MAKSWLGVGSALDQAPFGKETHEKSPAAVCLAAMPYGLLAASRPSRAPILEAGVNSKQRTAP